MKNKSITFLVQAAAIAAIYVVLTLCFAAISFGQVQIRIAEALTILPFFTPAAIPGLFIGCLIANILGGAILPDILFGSLATLTGAWISYRLRSHQYLIPLGPIITNTIVVPLVLRFGYGVALPLPLLMISIAMGEVISCGVLGEILLILLKPYSRYIFRLSGSNA